jgi:hypothetical protein
MEVTTVYFVKKINKVVVKQLDHGYYIGSRCQAIGNRAEFGDRLNPRHMQPV